MATVGLALVPGARSIKYFEEKFVYGEERDRAV